VHLHKKFQKIQKFIEFTAACPNQQKAKTSSSDVQGLRNN
jgi:hypothetical protein